MTRIGGLDALKRIQHVVGVANATDLLVRRLLLVDIAVRGDLGEVAQDVCVQLALVVPYPDLVPHGLVCVIHDNSTNNDCGGVCGSLLHERLVEPCTEAWLGLELL